MQQLHSTAVVEVVKDNSKMIGSATVYFYFENSQRHFLKGSDLLASLIKQLLLYLDTFRKPWPGEIEKDVLRFFGKKRLEADFDDLAEIAVTLLKYMPNTMCVIDGLDELDENEAKKVLCLVRRLLGNRDKRYSLRVLLFSRDHVAPYLDVTRLIPGTLRILVSNNTTRDLQLFIDSKISDKMCIRELPGGPDLIAEIKRRLLEEASNMYVFYMKTEQQVI
jgi:hypothetical protein